MGSAVAGASGSDASWLRPVCLGRWATDEMEAVLTGQAAILARKRFIGKGGSGRVGRCGGPVGAARAAVATPAVRRPIAVRPGGWRPALARLR